MLVAPTAVMTNEAMGAISAPNAFRTPSGNIYCFYVAAAGAIRWVAETATFERYLDTSAIQSLKRLGRTERED